MNKHANRGDVSPWQLFALLVIVRITASLGEIGSLARGVPASDMLLSLVLGGLLTVLLSLPLYGCLSKNKNPFESSGIALLYSLYFVLLQAFNVAAFVRFSISEAHPEAGAPVIVILATLACAYAAALGIEAIGRFAFLFLILLVPVIAIAVMGNFKNVEWLNFYPLLKNGRAAVPVNALLFATNSSGTILAAALAPRVNGNAAKAYYASVGVSFGVMLLFVSVSVGVTGYAAEAYDYPVYALFKMASFGSLTRLDAVHTAYWILAFFLKGSAVVYSAAAVVKHFTHVKKCVAAALLSGAAALALSSLPSSDTVRAGTVFRLSAAALLQVVVPLLYLIIKRKGRDRRA